MWKQVQHIYVRIAHYFLLEQIHIFFLLDLL